MKRVTQILIIFVILFSISFGYTLKWANYDLIDPASDITRSLAYSPFTDHLYVATRLTNPRIVILNPEDGTQIGTLNTMGTGFEVGTYTLNLVAVADDGVIYACNLSAPAYSPTSKFRIYRYVTEDATPELIFDDALEGIRYGDSFAAVGSGENTYLYSSGFQSNLMAVFTVNFTGATLLKTITLPTNDAARQGISPVAPGGNMWINGAGSSYPPVRLIDFSGTIIAEVPDTIIAAGGSSSVMHWSVGPIKVVTATNASLSSTLKSSRYYEDELGTITFGYLGDDSDSLMLAYEGTTLNNNQNGSCALVYDSTRHWIYTVMGVNSIAAVDMNSLIRVATPRDSGLLAIQLDGKKKEYTQFERLERHGDHDLYFTWSNSTIYVGLTGSTLFAPYQQRGLYIAFDTDPYGPNGSTSQPDAAASIQTLPFAADVIVKLDSDDLVNIYSNDPADKWTTGVVYKWNGTIWVESEIGGLDISYGAMGLIGDGTDSLMTEIGIARSPMGIGSDVTTMRVKVYLAETDVSGAVLVAFPDPGQNQIGSSVTFSDYYVFDNVGSGIYPAKDVRIESASSSIDGNAIRPQEFELSQNYPNPFNPATSIAYQIPSAGDVQLRVYDLVGNLVAELVDDHQSAGIYRVEFDGRQLSSGIYFYRLKVNGQTLAVRKMALMK